MFTFASGASIDASALGATPLAASKMEGYQHSHTETVVAQANRGTSKQTERSFV